MALSIRFGLAKSNLERCGISIAALAKILNLSASKLSECLRDQGKLQPDQEAEFDTLVSRLSRWNDACAPFSLPKDWEALRELAVSKVTPTELKEFVDRIIERSL